MEASEAIKKYVSTKISRLQKLLQQPLIAKVILSVQKQRHVAEVQVSSGPKRSEAKESSEEMYASIDKVVDKLERQISASKSEIVSKKRRSKATVRQGERSESTPPKSQSRAEVKKKTPAKKAKVVKKLASE
jgi:putative sigma-54 modulation protein